MSEVIYMYRRKGQDAWATCDENRYLELGGSHLFEVRIIHTGNEYAALSALPQPAAVEAVEVVAVAFITRAEKSGPKIAITLKKEDAEKQHKNWLSMSKIITTEPLMTVAQHQRILAASVGSGEPVGVVFTMEALAPGGGVKSHASLNRDLPAGTKLYTHPADQVEDDLTMVKVSRELLERVAKPVETQYDRDQRWIALEELRALLAKP